MTSYEIACAELQAEPRSWLITGVAGFIGSHLLETLLQLGQRVIGLDDVSTGSPRNLEDVRNAVGADAWKRFDFREGTITDVGTCRDACNYADYVLHQAAFVSVPLSIEDPVGCHNVNVNGTLNMLIAARDNRVRRFVHASSRTVYGGGAQVPTAESAYGKPSSPYAATKKICETYTRMFFDLYGLETINLRYFNIFGPRQNPFGAYAAVIPQWIDKCLRDEPCTIHGSAEISRDFCPVINVVQANIVAATTRNRKAISSAYNVASGTETTLGRLYKLVSETVAEIAHVPVREAQVGPPREEDLQQSLADIERIKADLGFTPLAELDGALREAVLWYANRAKKR